MRRRNIILGFLTSVFLTSAGFSADKYEFDKAHTTIGFSVKHMVLATVRGHFKEYSGNIMLDEKDFTNSSIQGTIQVASIDTEHERRDGHLKSADFFDTATYPEITFVSIRIEKKGESYVAVGDFTMRGVTKEIELPFTIVGIIEDQNGGTRIGIEAHAIINRQDFGVSWNRTLDNGGLVVSDEVKIEIQAELTKIDEENPA